VKQIMSQLLGAPAQVQGKSWSKLVQGRKCGQLIRSDEAIGRSPAQVCTFSITTENTQVLACPQRT
jgi:hypothetical protein